MNDIKVETPAEISAETGPTWKGPRNLPKKSPKAVARKRHTQARRVNRRA